MAAAVSLGAPGVSASVQVEAQKEEVKVHEVKKGCCNKETILKVVAIAAIVIGALAAITGILGFFGIAFAFTALPLLAGAVGGIAASIIYTAVGAGLVAAGIWAWPKKKAEETKETTLAEAEVVPTEVPAAEGNGAAAAPVAKTEAQSDADKAKAAAEQAKAAEKAAEQAAQTAQAAAQTAQAAVTVPASAPSPTPAAAHAPASVAVAPAPASAPAAAPSPEPTPSVSAPAKA